MKEVHFSSISCALPWFDEFFSNHMRIPNNSKTRQRYHCVLCSIGKSALHCINVHCTQASTSWLSLGRLGSTGDNFNFLFPPRLTSICNAPCTIQPPRCIVYVYPGLVSNFDHFKMVGKLVFF